MPRCGRKTGLVDYMEQFADALSFFVTLQSKVKFEGMALNVIDHLSRIDRRIGHLRVKQGNEIEVSPLFFMGKGKCYRTTFTK